MWSRCEFLVEGNAGAMRRERIGGGPIPPQASKLQGCVCSEEKRVLLAAPNHISWGIPQVRGSRAGEGSLSCPQSLAGTAWSGHSCKTGRALLSSVTSSHGNSVLNISFKQQVLEMAKKSGLIKAQLLSSCQGSAGGRGKY